MIIMSVDSGDKSNNGVGGRNSNGGVNDDCVGGSYCGTVATAATA